MSEYPIGIFDSGLGGLTAVKELINVLPQENIIYFGDTGRVPYGNRSCETITRYARQDASFLLSKGVKLIIAACGTVSSVVTNMSDYLSVPFTGVVVPTATSAVNVTKNGKIGVIGTSATIKSGSYKKEIMKQNDKITVYEQDCPLFVPLVENGFISSDNEITKLVVEHYLAPLKNANIDTLILGCTHYPIIANTISHYIGHNVTLIDSGRETALYATHLLQQNNLLNKSQKFGQINYYVSDTIDGFSHTAEIFLGKSVDGSVSHINIEHYEPIGMKK